jgi:hypothetical protein
MSSPEMEEEEDEEYMPTAYLFHGNVGIGAPPVSR